MQNKLTEIPEAHQILEYLKQGVISTDLDGIVTFWNTACEDIFGYLSEEMTNQSLRKIYPSTAEQTYRQDIQKLKSGKEVQGQRKSVTKNGEAIWLDIHARPLMGGDGNPKAFIASAHDIGELKRVEKELEENKARAQAILETTVDGIITTDIEGRIVNFNHSASRMFGYNEEEIIGKNVNALIPEPHSLDDNYVNRYSETVEKREVGYRREMVGRCKDGSTFPLELSVSEVEWEGRRLFTAVINDISERRRLEREILRISEEERRSLGQDLHDGLGQMLTGIHLISKNLVQKFESSGIPGSDKVQEISELIKEADEYAKALAHGLVHVDFKEEGIAAALVQLAQRVEKLFNVNCRVDNIDIVTFHNNMQGMHLYRIVQESISNAVKHGKASNITISLKADNGSLKLSVKDNGIGFTESQKQKKNMGMGINIMRYRASILSGRIDIFETDNKETKVVCTIPYNN